ncbi:MAG TPA: hypothetical protein VHC19_29855 [Pirellulales bacterium]|jgi:hypothetical protein|nr:hypothetical protein [Pirellulales bacterium]
MSRHAKLLLMKEILEHLDDRHQEWVLADDDAGSYLADAIKRDLEEIRRLCDSLKSDSLQSRRAGAIAAA